MPRTSTVTVASGQPGRQLLENLGAPRRDDQVVARAASSVANASPMPWEAPVTTARAVGDGAGTGMRQS